MRSGCVVEVVATVMLVRWEGEITVIVSMLLTASVRGGLSKDVRRIFWTQSIEIIERGSKRMGGVEE